MFVCSLCGVRTNYITSKIGKGIKFNYITSTNTFKNVSGIQNVIIYAGTVCVLCLLFFLLPIHYT